MKKCILKECVKMKNKYVSSYIYFKKRFILLVSINKFCGYHSGSDRSCFNGNGFVSSRRFHVYFKSWQYRVEKAETVNRKKKQRNAMVFYWMFRIFLQEGEYPLQHAEVGSAVMVFPHGYHVSIDDLLMIIFKSGYFYIDAMNMAFNSTSSPKRLLLRSQVFRRIWLLCSLS